MNKNAAVFVPIPVHSFAPFASGWLRLAGLLGVIWTLLAGIAGAQVGVYWPQMAQSTLSQTLLLRSIQTDAMPNGGRVETLQPGGAIGVVRVRVMLDATDSVQQISVRLRADWLADPTHAEAADWMLMQMARQYPAQVDTALSRELMDAFQLRPRVDSRAAGAAVVRSGTLRDFFLPGQETNFVVSRFALGQQQWLQWSVVRRPHSPQPAVTFNDSLFLPPDMLSAYGLVPLVCEYGACRYQNPDRTAPIVQLYEARYIKGSDAAAQAFLFSRLEELSDRGEAVELPMGIPIGQDLRVYHRLFYTQPLPNGFTPPPMHQYYYLFRVRNVVLRLILTGNDPQLLDEGLRLAGQMAHRF